MSQHRNRGVTALGGAFLLSLVLTACGSGSSDGGASSGGDAGPPRAGGSIIYGISADPICVDPNQTDLTASRDIGRQIADSVVDADPKTGEIKPWLATSWKVNTNATSFEFTFRDDVTFSNGEKFDANAFKTFLDGIKALGGKAVNASTYIVGYEGTTVTGPNTATVTFSQPNASFLQALSTVNMAVLSPKTYTGTTPANRCLGKELIGSGAFVLDGFVPAQSVVLTKRSGYKWPSPNAKHTGDAYLDKITFRVVPENGQRTGGLRSGGLHGINGVPTQDQTNLTSAGFQLIWANNPGTVSEYLTNNSAPILSDEKVRAAVQLGINNEEVRDTLLLPTYNVATSILSSTTPYYKNYAQHIRHDPDKARQLLDEAGWQPGPDGIRVKDGRRLKLTVVNGQAGAPTQDELRAQQLRKIGVELEIKPVSRAQMLASLDTGDYDFVPYGFTRADPAALNMHFRSTGGNPLHLKPSELDTYLAQADAAADTAARQVAVDKAAEYILQHHLVIVFTEQQIAHAVAPKLHGVAFEPGVQLTFYDAWLSS
ncbi:ABC transporter substrate-binding protein [Dactylosporangium fulvum]|uniref:ABC transporter substrate-binding protein n=1 Tax=Dactylosporangium fulvum TaxID=53359 RepID=A0ABY5VP81_9ACTN|nr:ABC transporter substrate-binding protein [Dactylosporangium fulvum]UWP78924.1 ABC transporter substrate-binding protein [Dactylosporangium fulvum]